jgi:hypothetical protein
MKREPNYDLKHRHMASYRELIDAIDTATTALVRMELQEKRIREWFAKHDESIAIHNGAVLLFGKEERK